MTLLFSLTLDYRTLDFSGSITKRAGDETVALIIKVDHF